MVPSDAVAALNDTAKPAVFLVKTIICWDDEKDSYDEEEKARNLYDAEFSWTIMEQRIKKMYLEISGSN